MYFMKNYHHLSETELRLLNELVGSVVNGFTAADCYHTLGKFAYTLANKIILETEGQSLCIELLHSSSSSQPLFGLLNVTEQTKPEGFAVNLILPAWSVISKIEVWAEKITDNNENTVVAENTLLFAIESGLRILICPEHPEDSLGLYCDEMEIESILGTGRFLLKHIMD